MFESTRMTSSPRDPPQVRRTPSMPAEEIRMQCCATSGSDESRTDEDLPTFTNRPYNLGPAVVLRGRTPPFYLGSAQKNAPTS